MNSNWFSYAKNHFILSLGYMTVEGKGKWSFIYSNNCAEMSWGKKYQPLVLLNDFPFWLYCEEMSCGGLAPFLILTVVLYSKILTRFIMHYNKTQLLYITGVMQRKWIFFWVPVIVKEWLQIQKMCLDNNPVNRKNTLGKERSMAHRWKG
jgi:hypothetical protein